MSDNPGVIRMQQLIRAEGKRAILETAIQYSIIDLEGGIVGVADVVEQLRFALRAEVEE